MLLTIPTVMMTTIQLEDLLRDAVIRLTMAGEQSAELEILDEYFTLGEPDDEDERRRDLLTLLEILDPIYGARLEFEHI